MRSVIVAVAPAFLILALTVSLLADDAIQAMTTEKYDIPWLLFAHENQSFNYGADEVMYLIEPTVYPETWDESVRNAGLTPASDKGTMRVSGKTQLVVRQTQEAHAAIKNLLKVLKQVVDDRQKENATQSTAGRRAPRKGKTGGAATLTYTVPGDPQKVTDGAASPGDDGESGYVVQIYRLGDLVRFADLDHVNQSVAAIWDIAPSSWNVVGGDASIVRILHLEVFVIRQTPEVHERIEEYLDKIRRQRSRR